MMKTIKVAYLFGSLNRGGLETLMLDVFRNASVAKYEFIGIYRKPGLLEKEFVDSGVPMYRLRPKHALDLGYLMKMRRIMKDNKVDIVHSQTPLDALIALLVTVGTKVKVVTTYHSGSFAKRKMTGYVMKHADLNLYVSKYQKEKYLEVYGIKNAEKHGVLYNGVSFDKFPIPTVARDCKNECVQLGMVGNFTLGRSQMFVCKFLKTLKERNIGFKFYFVGTKVQSDPQLYDDCVKYCEENGLADSVCFMGTRNDVPKLLQQWDAYIYSTVHDSFGISVIEAIASGLPTFVNDWPVMEEITDNGTYATVYKSNDENDLFEKFVDFVDNRQYYCDKAFVAAEEVRKKYGIKEYMANLYGYYKDLK